MVTSNSSEYPSKPELSEHVVVEEQPVDRAAVGSSLSHAERPWLIALGSMLLIAVGFTGWQWWHDRQTSNTAPPFAQVQSIPVKLETVKTSTIQESSDFIGSLVSSQSVTIKPQIQGRVSRFYVTEGAKVAAGDPLIQLSPEQQTAQFASVQAAVTSARAARANALAQLQSMQSERTVALAEVELQDEQYLRRSYLVQEGALSQEQLDLAGRDRQAAIAQRNALEDRIQAARANLDQAEAAVEAAEANATLARTQLQETTLVAPFAGIVGHIPVKLGDFVGTGDILTTVTQNNPLHLELSIPVERRSDLHTGLLVQLSDVRGNSIGTGRIAFIAPDVAPDAQSILVQAYIPNSNGKLQHGQNVRAQVIWQEHPGILIPAAAVTRQAGQAFVYVAEQPTLEGKAGQPVQAKQPQLVVRQIPVEVGDLQGNHYPVFEGLEAGDRVVVSGALKLKDGTPIESQNTNPHRAGLGHFTGS